MFSLFKKKIEKPVQDNIRHVDDNTKKIEVLCSNDGVKVISSNGKEENVNWNEIIKVSIITTDEGPFVDDVFLCLFGIEGKSGCVIPATVDGYNQVYDKVSTFNNFNFQRYIESMSSCINAEFICWERL